MRWIIGILLFFFMVLLVNSRLAYVAFNDRAELIEEKSYEHGLEYQETIDQMQSVVDSGFKGKLSIAPSEDQTIKRAVFKVSDREGDPLEGAIVSISAKYAAAATEDFETALPEEDAGEYAANVPIAKPGVWLINVSVEHTERKLLWKFREVLR